eukprot:TRINITY_DN59578_c0_g2_i1.p1 TRINITY_DN59578_c0_g2~~TRINITY_DN59578_c0_g2_i1.p1  ORF type:complete len:520 (+),score=117.21 TRINITY_DN59578_c0_g2_i1:73-1632(+)
MGQGAQASYEAAVSTACSSGSSRAAPAADVVARRQCRRRQRRGASLVLAACAGALAVGGSSFRELSSTGAASSSSRPVMLAFAEGGEDASGQESADMPDSMRKALENAAEKQTDPDGFRGGIADAAVASALRAPGAAPVQEAAPAPQQPPARYSVHAGAGDRPVGELHVQADGFVTETRPRRWVVEYLKRWNPLMRGWHPEVRLRAEPGGHTEVLRCSKALMADDDVPEENRLADGTGLDLHLETSLSNPASSIQGQALPSVLSQKAEVVVGPLGQAKYLNFSLPVGFLLGAEVTSASMSSPAQSQPQAIDSNVGPVRLYARLHAPGLRELRGWVCESQVDDAKLGLFQGHVHGHWHQRQPHKWALEHMRTHSAIRLPRFVGEWVASIEAAAREALGGAGAAQIRPAVVPSTRLLAGSDGNAAALKLESSQSGLGGSGWDGTVEVGHRGWGAGVHLTAGTGEDSWGKPAYSIAASAPWGSAARLIHEIKWMFTDGQGVWAKVTQNEGKKPRVHFGMEIR